MDAQTTAVILAAGKGSRMAGLPANTNKCALPVRGITPLGYTVSTLAGLGVGRFVVVTGYAAPSVQSALQSLMAKHTIHLVHNPHFEYHGCNYSLACAAASGHIPAAGRLLIAEGDSLHVPASLAQLLATPQDAAVLLRGPEYVVPSKSVVALGEGELVRRFAYNADHADVLRLPADEQQVVGESMQLWAFGGGPLAALLQTLRQYKQRADESAVPLTDSGVHSINEAHLALAAVQAAQPNEWINMNTRADIEKLEDTPWFAIS